MNVQLTANFRLTSDGERSYQLVQRITVDPTKAPGYKAAPDGSIPPKREEWRPIDAWYPLNDRGLAAAIKSVIARESVAVVSDGLSTSLRDYLTIINAISTQIDERIGYVFETRTGAEVAE